MNWILTRKGGTVCPRLFLVLIFFSFLFFPFKLVFKRFVTARKLLHCEVEAMERGVFVFCRRFKKETFILQEEKTNKVITTKWLRLFFFFLLVALMTLLSHFSGPLVQLDNFHVYTILLFHLVWLEKFSLSSLEILYNKVKSHRIRFKNK